MISHKKDIGLLVLILLVGGIVALINPLFLSPINLSNTANLIGLFGIFAIGQAVVIITGGIDLSVGSVMALLGVLFVDMLVNLGLPWPLAMLVIPVLGVLIGLTGVMLIWGAFHPEVRTLVLLVAGTSKLTFIGLVLSHAPYRQKAIVPLAIDSVLVMLFAIYLVGTL